MDHPSALPSFDLKGKTAVVTGGAGVLCSAICEALAEAGAAVAVLDINVEAAEALAARLCSRGANAVGLACNVLDKASIEACCKAVLERFGQVDILVNGAG